MGREVTFAETNKKSNGAAGPIDSLPLGKITNENSDKEYEVKECTTEKTMVEEKQFNENQEEEEEEEEEEETEEVSDDNKFNGNGYTNCTIPQPFEFATEKRGPCMNRHLGTNSPVGFASPKSSMSSPFRNSQPNSPMTPRKLLQPKKYHADEEDNYSITSSAAASVRTVKSVKAVTVGSAPTFISGDRAEKRREYYMKLEEKQRALEEERRQCEARQREEQEAAIKQMRRNMVVRAKPVPSFYYEGPPPKIELKKLPLTRPQSPKLSRRKSCSDAVRSSPTESVRRICARAQRHSIATIKEASSFSITPKSKPATYSRRSSNGGTRQDPKQEKEMNAIPCDISVES